MKAVSSQRLKKQRREERRERWYGKIVEGGGYSSASSSSDSETRVSLPSSTFTPIHVRHAFGGLASDVEFKPQETYRDAEPFYRVAKYYIYQLLSDSLENGPIKFSIAVTVILQKQQGNEVHKTDEIYLPSFAHSVRTKLELWPALTAAIEQSLEALDQFNAGGSGFTGDEVVKCAVKVSRWKTVRSNERMSGSKYFLLPPWLTTTNALVNIKNEDDFCFKYAIESAYSPPCKDFNIPRTNRHIFNFGAISFPFDPKDLCEFERLNKNKNMSIAVFYVDLTTAKSSHHISNLYCSANPDHKAKEINLLLVELNPEQRHWVWIRNLSRLFRLGDRKGGTEPLQLCRRCMQRCTGKQQLEEHLEHCQVHEEIKVEFPKPEVAFLSFKNYRKKMEKEFIVVADFECLLVQPALVGGVAQSQRVTAIHVPCGYCYMVICTFDPSLSVPPRLYRTTRDKIKLNTQGIPESDVGQHFLDSLMKEQQRIVRIMRERLNEGEHMKLTAADEKAFQTATHCHICELPFLNGYHPNWKNVKVDSQKVRDHDHCIDPAVYASNFRGAAHSACNLQFSTGFKHGQNQFFIPVVIHNLRGYDGHIIMKALNSGIETDDIHAIPQDGEKFMSFGFSHLKFIDSMNFLGASLESLVKILKKEGDHRFKLLHQYYLRLPELWKDNKAVHDVSWDEKDLTIQSALNLLSRSSPTPDRFQLLLRKGEYPYEYMNSIDRFDEKSLPSQASFFSSLQDYHCSDQDYAHAQRVWVEFGCRDLGDYHDLYLLSDVMLLGDVLQRFREIALKENGLEPLNYLSLPGYSLDACLKSAAPIKRNGKLMPFQVEVFGDCLNHKDMHLFCESAVRGGISMIPGRYAKANHPGLLDYSPPSDLSQHTYILYVDANNLYGWAMSQSMPIGHYVWADVSPFTTDYILSLDDDGETGYLLEVDLEVPVELHDTFKDYPVAPEKLVVPEEEVSPYSKAFRKRLDIKHDKTEKLLCTLHNKTKYITHYRNLKLYFKLGLKLKVVHRVLSFFQAKWIQPYITQNSQKRAATTNTFEKDYYKLLNNACYGKFLQNDRKHKHVNICTEPWIAEKHIADPYFVDRTIVNPEVTMVYKRKKKVLLNKPIIVGVCILELSKWLMYDFFYNTIKKQFGDRATLLMTDTDSLCMQLTSLDLMKEIESSGIADQFDFSNYPPSHPMFNEKNKAVIGKFKDETGGHWINEFVGLRSKMYSCLIDKKDMTGKVSSSGEEKKRGKGIKRHIVANKISHADYKQCVTDVDWNPAAHSEIMRGFQSRNQQLYSTFVTKNTLSPADDKLYQRDGIFTLPYGHASICTKCNCVKATVDEHVCMM